MPESYEEIVCVSRPERIEDLDEAGYLMANPDVARAGMAGREHFERFGQKEGRMQFQNLDRVRGLREQKLARLRFRVPPKPGRQWGEPANFLSAEDMAEFNIPEAPPVSANQYGEFFLDEVRSNPELLYLDVGAGLRYSVQPNVINAEIYPSISTDVLCVGEALPFEDALFDYVICAAVLEHTRRPWDVAREICRVTKPGGRIWIDYPFLQGVHGYPHHYFNATPQGAISLFEDYCAIESSTIQPNNHPIQSIWWLLFVWRAGLQEPDRTAFEAMTVADILAAPPDAHMDAAFCRNLSEEARFTIPAGSTLRAIRKPDVPISPTMSGRRTDVESRLLHAEATLRALQGSTSWRLTAPLRGLMKLLKRADIMHSEFHSGNRTSP